MMPDSKTAVIFSSISDLTHQCCVKALGDCWAFGWSKGKGVNTTRKRHLHHSQRKGGIASCEGPWGYLMQ